MITAHHFFRFAVFFSFVTDVHLSFLVYAPGNLTCQTSGVQCLGNDTFTTCGIVGTFTVLAHKLKCPYGYVCDDSTTTPCVDESATATGATETTKTIVNTSTTGVTETTTVVTSDVSTKRVVARPTTAPDCTATGTYPAPACNQYYVCEEKSILWVWKYYEAVLYTCSDGDYFDTGLSACITAELSDCVE